MTNLGHRVRVGQSYQSVERTMARVRSNLAPGVSEVEAFPCDDLVERLDEVCVRFSNGEWAFLDLDIFDAGLSSPFEGRTHFDPVENRMVVGISAWTYEGLLRNAGRARFTLMHELSHVVLHAGMMVRRSLMSPEELHTLNRETGNHPSFMDTEWQANAGASALLMPATGMRRLSDEGGGELTVERVATVYGVSHTAARIRMELMGSRGDALVAAGAAGAGARQGGL